MQDLPQVRARDVDEPSLRRRDDQAASRAGQLRGAARCHQPERAPVPGLLQGRAWRREMQEILCEARAVSKA
eukprot:361197-Hanusia_phi.AAC.1